MSKRPIGRTTLSVTGLGLGGTTFGNMFTAVESGAAKATVGAALAVGIRYFDTAPLYGFGLSESRLGESLKQAPRDEIVISSKVGYNRVPVEPSEVKAKIFVQPSAMRPEFDFTRDAVLRSTRRGSASSRAKPLPLVHLVHKSMAPLVAFDRRQQNPTMPIFHRRKEHRHADHCHSRPPEDACAAYRAHGADRFVAR